MEVWTIKRMLDWMEGYLAEHGDSGARASTFWLVSDALDMSRTELFLNYDMPLAPDQLDTLRSYVRKRAEGEPLQYITGKTFFRHIEVQVEPGVLIPRPETEVLVSEVLAHLPSARKGLNWNRDTAQQDSANTDSEHQISDAENNKGRHHAVDPVGRLMLANGSMESPYSATGSVEGIPSEADAGEDDPASNQDHPDLQDDRPIRIAEIGCGSGCIACSLAYEHPGVEVFCSDISDNAVELTRRNSEALGLSGRVHVVECDLGDALEGKFDAVVSNPPYIPRAVLASMPDEVTGFEPRLALDGGEDGLDIFRRIIDWSRDALKDGGLLACELHEESLEDAAAVAEAAGFSGIRIVEDLAGRPRVLLAVRPI